MTLVATWVGRPSTGTTRPPASPLPSALTTSPAHSLCGRPPMWLHSGLVRTSLPSGACACPNRSCSTRRYAAGRARPAPTPSHGQPTPRPTSRASCQSATTKPTWQPPYRLWHSGWGAGAWGVDGPGRADRQRVGRGEKATTARHGRHRPGSRHGQRRRGARRTARPRSGSDLRGLWPCFDGSSAPLVPQLPGTWSCFRGSQPSAPASAGYAALCSSATRAGRALPAKGAQLSKLPVSPVRAAASCGSATSRHCARSASNSARSRGRASGY